MSFIFNDLFGGGMPGGHHHHFGGGGMGGDDSDDEPIDTEKYYKIVGVEKDATQDQIKKAYRKKAKQLHPDRHQSEKEKYQKLFNELGEAYEVLKDPQKRSLYDKYGEKGAKRGGGPRSGGLFEQMFGGGGPSRDHGPKKSPTIKTALDVTLTDIYCGTTKKLKIHRRVATDKSSTCPRCKGQGQITQVQRMGPMVLQQRRECPQCNGIGYKLERQEHTIEVHVPVGGRHGENITIQEQGNQYPDMAAGDVIIQLRQKKHNLFERKGADLGMNYKLSLRQALCGYKIKIPHVSGKSLIITPSDPTEIVQPGSLKVVHTLGLPQRYSSHIKGHLYIVMEVEMPKPNILSANDIKQFEKILPQQTIKDDNEEDEDNDDEEEDEKKNNMNNNNANNNNNNNQTQQPQKKRNNQQTNKKKQPKNKQFKNKRNSRKKNGKKGGNNKKNKNNKGGMFGGLAGAFGGGSGGGNGANKNKNDTTDKMDEDEEDEEIEEVECHTVDGNPKATPASASNYYHDDDEDGDGVQCRQM